MDEQKREYKRKYIRRFDIVQSVINRWDPIKLFPGDAAPFDEYEPEIAQIVALLDKNEHDMLGTAEGIFKVFSKWFGDDHARYFPLDDCKKVAAQIWQVIDDESIRGAVIQSKVRERGAGVKSNDGELFYIRLTATIVGILSSVGLSIRYAFKWVDHSKQQPNTAMHTTGLYTSYWTSVHHAIFIWGGIALVLVGVLVYLVINRPRKGSSDPEQK